MDRYKLSHECGIKPAVDERALIHTAKQLRTYNDKIFQRELDYRLACGDTKGIISAEDLKDALKEAKAMFSALEDEGKLAPLSKPIKRMRGQVESLQSMTTNIINEVAQRDCSLEKDGAKMSFAELENLIIRPEKFREIIQYEATTDKSIGAQSSFEKTSENKVSLGICYMWETGQISFCSTTGDRDMVPLIRPVFPMVE